MRPGVFLPGGIELQLQQGTKGFPHRSIKLGRDVHHDPGGLFDVICLQRGDRRPEPLGDELLAVFGKLVRQLFFLRLKGIGGVLFPDAGNLGDVFLDPLDIVCNFPK